MEMNQQINNTLYNQLTRIRCRVILGQNDVQCSVEVTQSFIETGCFREKIRVKINSFFKFELRCCISKRLGYYKSISLNKWASESLLSKPCLVISILFNVIEILKNVM